MKKLLDRKRNVNPRRTRKWVLLLGLLVCILFSTMVLADPPGSEPLNNTMPKFDTGPSVVMNGRYSGGLSESMSIDPQYDKDHFVITCPTAESPIIHSVSVLPWVTSGDLDMAIYQLNQYGREIYLGGSYNGGNSSEYVYLYPRNMSTVVLKVFGYRTAVGHYQVAVQCRAPYPN